MSRYADVDTLTAYFCQTYAQKHFIRDNPNLLILFKQDGINLKHMCNDVYETPYTCLAKISVNCIAVVGDKSMDS